MLSNRQARVFWLPSRPESLDQTVMYGCLRSNGRAIRLQGAYDSGEDGRSYTHVKLAGRFVAWDDGRYDITCKADCPPGYVPNHDAIAVRDLRRHHTRFVQLTSGAGAVAVNHSGGVAWVQGSGNAMTVHARDSSGERTLDRGRIDDTSLKVRGGTVRWLNAGQPRSAPLGRY